MRSDYVEKGWQRWVFVYIPIAVYVICIILLAISSITKSNEKSLLIFLLCFIIVDVTAFGLFGIIKYFRRGRHINGLLALIVLLCCLVLFALFVFVMFQTVDKVTYHDFLRQQLDMLEYGTPEYDQLLDELQALTDETVDRVIKGEVLWFLFNICVCLLIAGLPKTKPFEERLL